MTETHDDTTSQDDPFPPDESNAHRFVVRQSRSGKTTHLGRELARRLADDAETTEFADPKADTDAHHDHADDESAESDTGNQDQ